MRKKGKGMKAVLGRGDGSGRRLDRQLVELKKGLDELCAMLKSKR